jgi:hypothetical protein
MPFLDVSDVILDPDFVDRASYARQAQIVGLNGIATSTPITQSIFGVCTSDKGDVLGRNADGSMVGGTILFHTRARLIAGSPAHTADILTWAGRRYTVIDVNNYSRYGAGFVCAKCELIPLAG